MKEIIEKTSKLCKLKFDAAEIDLFDKQFSDILQYVSAIDKLPIDDLEPLARLDADEDHVRKDEVGNLLTLDEALKNAPKRNESFFKVPKQLDVNSGDNA